MVWFLCDDCGDRVKTSQLPRHFRFCSATKFSCVDCGNIIGQDSVQSHKQCITEAEYLSKMPSWFCSLCNVNATCEKDYFKHVNGRKHREEELDLADKQKRQAGQPTVDKENSTQQPNFDISIGLSNCDPWVCSLCNSKSTSQQSLLDHAYGRKHRANVEEYVNRQQRQSKPSIVDKKDNSNQQTEVDINVGLSNCYPWFCSLCNTKSTSQHSLLDHANGKKHRANVEEFGANLQQRQSEPSITDKDNSKQETEVDINVGLSNSYPWFCSLCNIKATCKQNLLAHADGWKHRANINYFAVEQQQQPEQSTVEKKDTIENASNGISEQKKVSLPVPSSVVNEYSQVDKKRKLQSFDKTWKGEVVQADEAKGGSERSSKSKKAKKKQTELDSDFENDREDLKLLLVSYSKEELVNLIYKTAEEGSRLFSAILESADLDINQRNIFVRGFGWDTTEGNLKAAFESYGDIEDCSVIMDKNTRRGKGYGFVLFRTRKGAREALRNPQKRMFNRTIICNLASEKPCKDEKPHDMVEPVNKIDPTSTANQTELVLPGLELAHGHMLQRREQQQTMEMFGQNMPFYGHSQLPGFDPMYGALRGSQMVTGPPNFSMFGSSMMKQRPMLPPSNHMGMAGQYFGDGDHAWHQR